MRRADKRTKKDTESSVESYLRSVGIGGHRERDAFWKRLREKHGPIAEQVAHAISAREEGEEVDVYPLKNATLAVSIDVTSQYYNQMYTEFLNWFRREKFPEPTCLLDVGCDNGILTCFYASLHPRAEVVGIDKCEQGIVCARELAHRVKLANVRFEVCDLQSLEGAFPEQSFDLIMSTAVFHEVPEFPEDVPDSGCGSIATGPGDSDCARIVADLASLLRYGTGTMVSMERCADAEILGWWIRVLNQAGLSVDVDRSTLLTYNNMYNERETLPLVVAVRSRHLTVSSVEDIPAFRMYQDDVEANAKLGDRAE
jgi:SAM-dependent methyltransferase